LWSTAPSPSITPAEPGFTAARVEPALGHLDWATGSVPTPAGLLHIEVRPDRLVIDSPIPVDHADRRLTPGHHELM